MDPRKRSVSQSMKLKAGTLKGTLMSNVVMQGWVFALQAFGLVSVQYFLTILPFLPLRMVMYILCLCMLDVCDLLFDFDFTVD